MQKIGYEKEELIVAGIVLGVTSFIQHWANQRQVEQSLSLAEKIPYSRGLIGTVLRHSCRGMLLYCSYFAYFNYLARAEL